MGGACRGVCKFCFDLGLGRGCGSAILKGVCVWERVYESVPFKGVKECRYYFKGRCDWVREYFRCPPLHICTTYIIFCEDRCNGLKNYHYVYRATRPFFPHIVKKNLGNKWDLRMRSVAGAVKGRD